MSTSASTPSSTASGTPPAPSLPPPSPAASDAETTRAAGRGGLAITFAKVYFILLGLVQQVLLPRVLGLDGYGRLSSVVSAASIAYNPIVTASIQGVSRAVAQASEEQRAVTIRRTFLLHAAFALASAVAFYALSGVMADFQRAPHIAGALALVSPVLLLYGLYAPLVGVLNGGRRFVVQASFDVAFATLRTTALVVGGVLLSSSGRGVEGAIGGFVVVSGIVLVGALVVVGTGRSGEGAPPVRKHLAFVGPLLAAQILLNLLLQADLQLLRRFAGEAAQVLGLPSTAADPLVGAYRATQLFSFLPYQLLVSVTFILFPMLAVAVREGDRAAIGRYVAAGMRVALVVAGLLVSVTSGLSGPLLRLVYSVEVEALGTSAMQVLSLGFGSFAILGVLTAVLTSLGREKAAATVTGVAFALVVLTGFTFTRGAPFGEELLVRTAMATSVGLVLATLAAAVLVRRVAGSVVPLATAFRTLSCMAVCIVAARLLPEGGKLVTIALSGAVALTYLVLLVVTRELGPADLATLRLVIARRKR